MLNGAFARWNSDISALFTYPPLPENIISQLMAARNGGIMNGMEKRNFIVPFSGISLRPSSQAKNTPTIVANSVAKTAMIRVFFIAFRLSG